LMRLLAAVTLGIGHRDAEREVLVLHPCQVGGEAGAMLGGASGIVDARADLGQPVQRVVGQVALRAAGLLAQQAHRLEFVEQVAGRLVDVQHAVDHLAAAGLGGECHGCELRVAREVIGVGQRVDAGCERGLVGDRLDAAAIDVDGRPQTTQRFAVIGAAHQRGGSGDAGSG
jgi:hypothetical protein